jgi:hypothetical protein
MNELVKTVMRMVLSIWLESIVQSERRRDLHNHKMTDNQE